LRLSGPTTGEQKLGEGLRELPLVGNAGALPPHEGGRRVTRLARRRQPEPDAAARWRCSPIRRLVDGLPTRDRRSAVRLLRTFLARWPAIAIQADTCRMAERARSLASAAGCAEELQRVGGEVWPEDLESGPPLPLRGQ
jgi:hypothetical protein